MDGTVARDGPAARVERINAVSEYYTGVGSRKTPFDVLYLIRCIAAVLNREGWILRSGGAKGADAAFQAPATDLEVYLARHSTPKAAKIAEVFHPAWRLCHPYAKKLHGRNVLQVLGRDGRFVSKFLICWTPDGCTCHADRTAETGGTGTAISVASAWGVKVHNLANHETRGVVESLLLKGPKLVAYLKG